MATSHTKELQELREKVARLQAEKEANSGFRPNVQAEIAKIRQTGKKTADKIVLKENNDHKNISLWVRKGVNYGKRVGPLHPDNAESTLLKFAEKGMTLSVERPTDQEVKDYKETEEYKTDKAKVDKIRALKNKSKKPDQIDRLTEQMSRLTGQIGSSIMPQHQVKEGATGAKLSS